MLLAASAATGLAVFTPDAPSPALVAQAPSQAVSSRQEPRPVLTGLPARPLLEKARGEPFAAPAWGPRATPPPSAPEAAVPVAPPPVPYKFAGTLIRDGAVQHFVARGDVVLEIKEGDLLEGNYRVEALSADEITLLYVPLTLRARLALPGASDGPRAPLPAVASQSPASAASPPPLQETVVSAAAPVMRAAQLKAPRTFRPPAEPSKPPR